VVKRTWQWLGKQYGHVQSDVFIVMPNHLHGIIIINDRRGGSRFAPAKKTQNIGKLIDACRELNHFRIVLLGKIIIFENSTPGCLAATANTQYFFAVAGAF